MALTSSIQGPVHVVMLVVILIFAIQYQQLLQKYEDLASECKKNGNRRTSEGTGDPQNEELFMKTLGPGQVSHRNTDSVESQVFHGQDLYSSLHEVTADGVLSATESLQLSQEKSVLEIFPTSNSFSTAPLQAAFKTETGLSSSVHEFVENTGVADFVDYNEATGSAKLHMSVSFQAATTEAKTAATGDISLLTSSTKVAEESFHASDVKPQELTGTVAQSQTTLDDSTAITVNSVGNSNINNHGEGLLGVPTNSDSMGVDSRKANIEIESSESKESCEESNRVVQHCSKSTFEISGLDTDINDLQSLKVKTLPSSDTEQDSDLKGSSLVQSTEAVYSTSFLGTPEALSDEEESDVADEDLSYDFVDIVSPLLSTSDDLLEDLRKRGTVLHCQSHLQDSPACFSQNLCYNTAEKDFMVFVRDENTDNDVDDGVDSDLSSISLTSVPNHNAQLLRPVMVPTESLDKFSISFVETPSFLLSRFKPDNIMHALHDDVVPLFHSLHSMRFPIRKNRFDVTLVFTDQYEEQDLSPLYSALSIHPPLSLWKQENTSEVICFPNAYFGLSNQTLWYQYGFTTPQGPLSFDQTTVGPNIQRAAAYISEQLFTKCIFCHSRNYLVLLSRKDNRLIMNEGPLILSLAQRTKLKVMSVSLETHSLQEIISIVKGSRGIVGVHGSLLSVAMFLQPGSFVIELFPYAINPLNYTPFKTLASLRVLDILYQSWTNKDKSKSFPHPEWPAELGGIHHLPSSTQKEIVEQKEVPSHLCCDNPSWLYHIYQDTEVSVEEVTSLVEQALLKASNSSLMKKKSRSQEESKSVIRIPPGPVRDLSCHQVTTETSSQALVTWRPPWNLQFVSFKTCSFHVIYQNRETQNSVSVDVSWETHEVSIPDEKTELVDFNIWVSVVCDGDNVGFSKYTRCKS